MKDLYAVNERVAILNEKYFGYMGIIQELKDTAAQVKLVEASYRTDEKI
jgi:hypothetical protein